MSYIYYTNPDGTIGTIEATHDQAGNLRPAGSMSSQYNGYTYNNEHYSSSSITKKSSGKLKESKTITKKEKLCNIISSWQQTKTFIPKRKNVEKILRRISNDSLKRYFKNLVAECYPYVTFEENESVNPYSESVDPVKKEENNSLIQNSSNSETEDDNQPGLFARFAQIRAGHPTRRIARGVSKIICKRKNTVRQLESAKAFDFVSGTISTVEDVLACIDSYKRRKESIPQSKIDAMSNAIARSGIRDFFRAKCAAYNRDFKLWGGSSEPIFEQKPTHKPIVKSSTPYISSSKPVTNKPKHKVSHRSSSDLPSSRGIYASTSGVQYVHPSRNKPKYGYARDRYGRIQERDHYVEGRETNRYHDNSNYDREDDNDSMYDNFD